MTHNPVAIANYFVEKSLSSPTVMKLIKLSYIAHGFKLGLGWGAMSNEPAQAWKFGPVFPSVYHMFKRQYPYDITQPAQNKEGAVVSSQFGPNDNKVLSLIYDLYGSVEAWQLSNLTHCEGTPWYKTYHKNGGSMTQGVEIDDAEVETHFRTHVIKKYNVEAVL